MEKPPHGGLFFLLLLRQYLVEGIVSNKCFAEVGF